MEHIHFVLLITIPLIIILLIDKKNFKKYMGIGILALILDLIWDPIMVFLGYWYYSSEPMIFGVSIYTLLLYVHYSAFCYFFGNLAAKRWKM